MPPLVAHAAVALRHPLGVLLGRAGGEDPGGGQRDQAAGQLNVTEALLPPVQVVVEAPTHDMV